MSSSDLSRWWTADLTSFNRDASRLSKEENGDGYMKPRNIFLIQVCHGYGIVLQSRCRPAAYWEQRHKIVQLARSTWASVVEKCSISFIVFWSSSSHSAMKFVHVNWRTKLAREMGRMSKVLTYCSTNVAVMTQDDVVTIHTIKYLTLIIQSCPNWCSIRFRSTKAINRLRVYRVPNVIKVRVASSLSGMEAAIERCSVFNWFRMSCCAFFFYVLYFILTCFVLWFMWISGLLDSQLAYLNFLRELFRCLLSFSKEACRTTSYLSQFRCS